MIGQLHSFGKVKSSRQPANLKTQSMAQERLRGHLCPHRDVHEMLTNSWVQEDGSAVALTEDLVSDASTHIVAPSHL